MAMMLATTGFASASDYWSVNGIAPNESYRNLLLELANNSSTEESSDVDAKVPILVDSGTEAIKDPLSWRVYLPLLNGTNLLGNLIRILMNWKNFIKSRAYRL